MALPYQEKYETTCDNSLYAKEGGLLVNGNYRDIPDRVNSVSQHWLGMSDICCTKRYYNLGETYYTTDCSRDCMKEEEVCEYYN